MDTYDDFTPITEVKIKQTRGNERAAPQRARRHEMELISLWRAF